MFYHSIEKNIAFKMIYYFLYGHVYLLVFLNLHSHLYYKVALYLIYVQSYGSFKK